MQRGLHMKLLSVSSLTVWHGGPSNTECVFVSRDLCNLFCILSRVWLTEERHFDRFFSLLTFCVLHILPVHTHVMS